MVKTVDKRLFDRLNRIARGTTPAIQKLLEAMRHTLESGGKRVRPLLALAAADAIGQDEKIALPGALAVELIHTYSLIHDDLPALDNDAFRRGQPACHIVYGEAPAILAGDALQSLAFEFLAEIDLQKSSALSVNRAILVLARAIGPLGMAGGQAEDLAFENLSPSFSETVNMARLKTGELIAASLEVGAALAGASPTDLKIFRKIGLLAGEAFQIVDDLLNLAGDPELLGKAVGTDAERGKNSILSHLGPDGARVRAKKVVQAALKTASIFNAPKLNWLLESLVNRVF
jgi:geranylgeranyl diphosphate synthase type II